MTKPEGGASKHFTWAELLYLPKWGIYHNPTDQERGNLLLLAHKLDEIRDFLGKPINVSCAIRPAFVAEAPGANKNYNLEVHGAQRSAHIEGLACDFTVSSMTADEVRFHLVDELERLQIRMERKPLASWTHVDLRQPLPGHPRYFLP